MHRALDIADIDLIWPKGPIVSRVPAIDPSAIEWTDKELNVTQRQFVLRVLNNTHGAVPFLLFGPFGTGKSRTSAELILQLVKTRQGVVLVCTQVRRKVTCMDHFFDFVETKHRFVSTNSKK